MRRRGRVFSFYARGSVVVSFARRLDARAALRELAFVRDHDEAVCCTRFSPVPCPRHCARTARSSPGAPLSPLVSPRNTATPLVVPLRRRLAALIARMAQQQQTQQLPPEQLQPLLAKATAAATRTGGSVTLAVALPTASIGAKVVIMRKVGNRYVAMSTTKATSSALTIRLKVKGRPGSTHLRVVVDGKIVKSLKV